MLKRILLHLYFINFPLKAVYFKNLLFIFIKKVFFRNFYAVFFCFFLIGRRKIIYKNQWKNY